MMNKITQQYICEHVKVRGQQASLREFELHKIMKRFTSNKIDGSAREPIKPVREAGGEGRASVTVVENSHDSTPEMANAVRTV